MASHCWVTNPLSPVSRTSHVKYFGEKYGNKVSVGFALKMLHPRELSGLVGQVKPTSHIRAKHVVMLSWPLNQEPVLTPCKQTEGLKC